MTHYDFILFCRIITKNASATLCTKEKKKTTNFNHNCSLMSSRNHYKTGYQSLNHRGTKSDDDDRRKDYRDYRNERFKSNDLSNIPRGPKKMSFKLPKNEARNYGNSRTYRPAKKNPNNNNNNNNHNNNINHNNNNNKNFKPPPKPELKISFLKSFRNNQIYEKVVQVGEGTYGKVYKSQNIISKDFVALKKLRLESEREGFPITAMREIRLLQSFDHENIVPLLEIMVENKQIHMIFTYADHDLTGILSNPDINLSQGHCKNLFKQLLTGISHLHSKRVIHRDIKGSNLLISNNGVLKIADFGLARKMKPINNQEDNDYTNRVITLWYRPPELLLGTTDYGREVDMWGVGCLLVELFTKKAIFQAPDEIQQIISIFEILGTPDFSSWKNLNNLPWFEMLKPKKFYKSKFSELFSKILSKECFNLSLRLLEYDPRKRMNAQDALNHEYFKEDPPIENLNNALIGEWHEFEAKKKRQKEREEKKLEERKKRKINDELEKESTIEPSSIQNSSGTL